MEDSTGEGGWQRETKRLGQTFVLLLSPRLAQRASASRLERARRSRLATRRLGQTFVLLLSPRLAQRASASFLTRARLGRRAKPVLPASSSGGRCVAMKDALFMMMMMLMMMMIMIILMTMVRVATEKALTMQMPMRMELGKCWQLGRGACRRHALFVSRSSRACHRRRQGHRSKSQRGARSN